MPEEKRFCPGKFAQSTGLLKSWCVLWLLAPSALKGRGRCWLWAQPTASTFLSRTARLRAVLDEKTTFEKHWPSPVLKIQGNFSHYGLVL
ncbi:MAG TPA: hypothetical protein VFB60_28965 [Ktedonobacteraceae bacterium]|nr:hypothetical protein [Ktedonobacteraceae bacterium]